MTIDTKSTHVTPAGGNVFADLGFAPDEAKALKAKSDQIISSKLTIKESLMDEITVWIETNKLKQADAALILGITRPRVSDVIQKKSPKFTIDSLVEMLGKAGKKVTLSVQ